ncbi:MAG: DNA-3-methyladenine glycosylase family protein [Acutalibacteraceae bacterium]
MNYHFENNTAHFEITDNFDLEQTFSCGQCFRWEKNTDGSFSAVVGQTYCTVRKDGTHFQIQNIDESTVEQWIAYFDLDRNYKEIRDFLCSKCEKLTRAADYAAGIRILAQESWESLCSFIISQNNNIPRIRGIIDRLCRQFGSPCGSSYTFPTAETLSKCTVEDLAPLRAGFRAKYIIDAAQKVASGQIDFESLKNMPLADAQTELRKINGVGAKVADCTLLYGLHNLSAFPVDVWIKRALSTEFKDISPEIFQPYAGIAQQYIFHYMRLTDK